MWWMQVDVEAVFPFPYELSVFQHAACNVGKNSH